MVLSEASGLVEAVQELQRQMKQIQDTLQANHSANSSSLVSSSPTIPRTSWAEEMEEHQVEDEDRPDTGNSSKAPHVPRKVTDVSERTEQHLVQGFACMEDEDRRTLANSFALPKVAVTNTPDLDKIMVAQCSKNTKVNDQALARTQALYSDTLGPLTEVLELLNKEGEDFTEEHLNQVGYAVESAITLLGNAFAQMSQLRRQKILEEYNKELLTFAQGRKSFLKAAPELFGCC